MKTRLTTTIKLLLAAALVVAAYQFALAYRAETERTIANAVSFGHRCATRGDSMAEAHRQWEQVMRASVE